MNVLEKQTQIEIINALLEGVGQRAVARLTNTDRKTVARLALRVGRGCAELHDRLVIGVRTNRLELDELWAYVGRKHRTQQQKFRPDDAVTGDMYTYVGSAAASRAIIAYRTGKRDGAFTDDFVHDLRERVIGYPEISTDGYHPYKAAIRDALVVAVSHMASSIRRTA